MVVSGLVVRRAVRGIRQSERTELWRGVRVMVGEVSVKSRHGQAGVAATDRADERQRAQPVHGGLVIRKLVVRQRRVAGTQPAAPCGARITRREDLDPQRRRDRRRRRRVEASEVIRESGRRPRGEVAQVAGDERRRRIGGLGLADSGVHRGRRRGCGGAGRGRGVWIHRFLVAAADREHVAAAEHRHADSRPRRRLACRRLPRRTFDAGVPRRPRRICGRGDRTWTSWFHRRRKRRSCGRRSRRGRRFAASADDRGRLGTWTVGVSRRWYGGGGRIVGASGGLGGRLVLGGLGGVQVSSTQVAGRGVNELGRSAAVLHVRMLPQVKSTAIHIPRTIMLIFRYF